MDDSADSHQACGLCAHWVNTCGAWGWCKVDERGVPIDTSDWRKPTNPRVCSAVETCDRNSYRRRNQA